MLLDRELRCGILAFPVERLPGDASYLCFFRAFSAASATSPTCWPIFPTRCAAEVSESRSILLDRSVSMERSSSSADCATCGSGSASPDHRRCRPGPRPPQPVGSSPSRRSPPPRCRPCSPCSCRFSRRRARLTLRGIVFSRRRSASAAYFHWSFFLGASSRKPLMKMSRCDSNYSSACSMTSLPGPFSSLSL